MADTNQPPLPPQPDFGVLHNAMQSISTVATQSIPTIGAEIMKFQNVPAFNQGNQILAAIQGLENRILGLENRMINGLFTMYVDCTFKPLFSY